MIYKLQNKNLPIDLNIVCWSYDGSHVLIKSDLEIKALETYQDSDLPRLIQLPFWRQPCAGCDE